MPGRAENVCEDLAMGACQAGLSDRGSAVRAERWTGTKRGEAQWSRGVRSHWAFHVILKKNMCFNLSEKGYHGRITRGVVL